MFKQILLFTTILTTVGTTTVWAETLQKTPIEEKTSLQQDIKFAKNNSKVILEEKLDISEDIVTIKENIKSLEDKKVSEANKIKTVKEQIKKEEARIQKEKEEEIARKEREAMIAEENRIAEQKKQEEAERNKSVNTASTGMTSNTNTQAVSGYSGAVLTRQAGRIKGPSGDETYYNLPMGGVVSIAQSIGASGSYWVREDGVKMYGDYVMIAANLNIRPRGSLVPTSLGMGIVLDTGSFAESNPYQVDIAVNW